MKIGIIGASGFVGQHLYNHFQKSHEVVGTYCNRGVPNLVKLDISDRGAVADFFSKYCPNIVLLPAANPNVEWCEEHPAESWRVNVEGIVNVADAARGSRCKLVYYSTEYVFDGKNGPYSEKDTPNPIGVYGFHKYVAERYVLDILKDSLALRTTVIYGWEETGKNFVERFIKTLGEGKTFNVPIDQISSPTHISTLVQATEKLLEQDAHGVYNVVGPQVMSRYDFSLEICDVFGLDKKLVNAVETNKLGQKAKRPLNAGLLIDKLVDETGYKPVDPFTGLRLMKEERR